MRYVASFILCGLLSAVAAAADAPSSQPASAPAEVWVTVFDFETLGEKTGNAQALKDQSAGAQLADSIRLKLRRQPGFKVLDRLSTQEVAPKPVGQSADPAAVQKMLANQLGTHVGVYGTLQKIDSAYRAEVRILDLRPAAAQKLRRLVASDDTQRARAIMTKEIVEAAAGQKLWKPPEYGDEIEPTAKQFGRPLNPNSDFEKGRAGWDRPDGVSTFIISGDKNRGGILRVRTDLKRDPWLAWRRKIRLGQADYNNPPTIDQDKSYGCVGGLEGVHFRGDFLPATPGGRYWLTADIMPTTAKVNPKSMFFPKVFVKGFKHTPFALDGLPESSLAELKITPEQFAAKSESERKALILADRKKHPTKYLRECYRWYLACRAEPGQWSHFAAPFPPRGGLPKDVEYLQIQIYSYWPPGEYLWDNVRLYRDPRAPQRLQEEKPRTPNFGKTSDVVEAESKKPRPATAPSR